MIRMHSIEKAAVEQEVAAGNIRMQRSPFNDKLVILNYTEQAQFTRHWTPLTMRCRGLVVEWLEGSDYAPIVIESPKKFFNNTEPEAPDLTKWHFSQIFISEKLDGYYIAVRNDSRLGLIVTSRGSFDNQYVEAAKKLLPEEIPENVDYFCELCQDFPGDEGIIVSRHPFPKLVCWGVNNLIPTPELNYGWTGKIAREITKDQFKQYMQDEVEGVVAYNKTTTERVKIKTAWYLEMHRIINNCTFKNVLEIVMGGGEIDGVSETDYLNAQGERVHLLVSALPEEHIEQMKKWESEIWETHKSISVIASGDYDEWHKQGPKAYALKSTTPSDIKSIVFGMMRNKSYDEIEALTWKVVKNRLLRNTAD